jgi:ferrous iron transport protein B
MNNQLKNTYMTLADLKTGDTGIIIKVRGRGAIRKRIIEMGFIQGKEVRVIKNAPLKDPIEYKILDYNISLRRSESRLIEVLTPGAIKRRRRKRGCSLQVTEGLRRKARRIGKVINIALVGNPNSGKTTLFNSVSGSTAHVGNYAGVTVEARGSRFEQDGYLFNIVDLPGTYSLTSYSPEEIFVRQHITENTPDIVINVIDGSNLERNLYLTTQLIDMDIKIVVALNIYDELEQKGDSFDFDSMGKMIGVPFIPTVSSKGVGLKELFRKVIEEYEDRDEIYRHIHLNYGNDLERSICKIQTEIKKPENYPLTDKVSSRMIAIKLLEKDQETEKLVFNHCSNNLDILLMAKSEIKMLEEHLNEDTESLISNSRYGFITGALKETYRPAVRPKRTISEKIDSIVTHRLFGFPLFLAFMFLTFQLTFTMGEYPMGWIESFMRLVSDFLSHTMQEGLLKELVIDGIIAGVGGVIVFLPNILILFFMISLMEDTGYMARASFIMDKLMHKIGLHGKSFIPLIMGFGCNVPAIMATRTLENRNDKLITMLIIPFMSCSARLPVYVLFISAFFPGSPGTMLFAMYIIGIIVAIISSVFLKKTIFKSGDVPFVMELPPYRKPHLNTTSQHMWEKGIHYLKKIGGVVLVASVIIWALGRFPNRIDYSKNYDSLISQIEKKYESRLKDNSGKPEMIKQLITSQKREISIIGREKESERLEKSYIGMIGRFFEPVITPLGFDWKMGVSLLTGFAAKEIVVSTMGVLYHAGSDVSTESMSLINNIRGQTHGSGPRKGEIVITPLIAFGFMIFVLLYFPCIATMATIKRESGSWKWALFSALQTTTIAWLIAFLVYNIGSRIL